MEDKKFWSNITWTKTNYYVRVNTNRTYIDEMNSFREDLDLVPFCTIDLLTKDNYLLDRLKGKEIDYSNSNARVGGQYPNYYKRFIKPEEKIKDKIYKHLEDNPHLLYLGDKSDDTLKVSKEGFKQLYDKYTSKPLDLKIRFQLYNSTRSSPKVIENVCYIPYPVIVNCTKKDAPNKNYLTDYFFCAEIDNSIYQTFQTSGLVTTGIVPLFAMMVKKEFVPYVRACAINNIAINNEVLELWIDKSLDNPKSEHPIRAQFVKIIRQKCKKEGIPIRVFDDLKSELIKSPKPKKFKSIMEQKNYISNIVSKVIDNEKITKGIVSKPEDLDKTVLEILKDNPISESDIMQQYRERELEEILSAFGNTNVSQPSTNEMEENDEDDDIFF